MKSQSVVTDNLEVFAVVTDNWEVRKVNIPCVLIVVCNLNVLVR